jgi:hypothetical protein
MTCNRVTRCFLSKRSQRRFASCSAKERPLLNINRATVGSVSQQTFVAHAYDYYGRADHDLCGRMGGMRLNDVVRRRASHGDLCGSGDTIVRKCWRLSFCWYALV